MNNSSSISIISKEPINTFVPIKYKSKIVYGNVEIMLEKKINWFHRIMLKLVFGIKIEILGDKENE